MLTIDALNAYGADTRAGLARCLNNERFYLGLVEMLMNDARFDTLCAAVENMDTLLALHTAYALLCLQLQGDSAVLEKQLRIIRTGMEKLRMIDMT